MTAALLAAHLLAGTGIGLCYFHVLWWSVRRLARGAPAWAAMVAILARFAILAAVLALAGREGAGPLLATVAGVLAGRSLALRRMRGLPA